MGFDQNSLLASMLVSGIGFVLFKYGRKMQRPPHTLIGLIMLLYPYAVSDAVIMLCIAPLLLGLLWAATRFGL